MTVDSIIKTAYARLVGLQRNIPSTIATLEFIEAYHAVLDDLEPLGGKLGLSKFRIPNDAKFQDEDTNDIYCRSEYLRLKVDALLTLFDVSKDKIGYIAPK